MPKKVYTNNCRTPKKVYTKKCRIPKKVYIFYLVASIYKRMPDTEESVYENQGFYKTNSK